MFSAGGAAARCFLIALAAANAWAVDWRDERSVVEAALTNNPTLARMQAEAAAARERLSLAGKLPNPMLMAGIRDKQVDFTNDEMMTMAMVGASQTFSAPGKRDARRRAAELEIDVIDQQLAAERAVIERDALVAWYELQSIDSRLTTTEGMRAILDGVVDAARVRYEVGGSAQADVIRAQLERSELERELLRLRGERRAVVARLLPLTGEGDGEIPRLALAAERKTITAAPLDRHPAIAALRAEIARQDELIRLERLEATPDVDVEASYGYRPQQKDMVSVTARIELPLRREPRVREAMAMRDAAQQRVEELRRTLARELGVAAAMHAEAGEQLRLVDEVLVPQARLAFESTLAGYQGGKTTFDALLTAEAALLRFQVERAELVERQLRAAAEFEALQRGAVGRMS